MALSKRFNRHSKYLIAGITALTLLLAAAETTLYSAVPVRAVSETEIKAAYIYKFLLFINKTETKTENKKPFKIGIVADEEMTRLLKAVALRPVGSTGRRLEVKQLPPDSSPAALASNDILFIPQDQSENTEQIVEALDNAPVLTVSDMEGFLDAGGMVQFVRRGHNIGWAINRSAVQKAGIELSSQLYRNAQWVTPQRWK